MARNYANIMTAIWRERDWRSLRGSAQRTYSLLMSQPDITAAGVLALTLARWADMAIDTTVESLEADIDELVTARFVAVDPATMEILVRTFVKWDGGYVNSKRRPVILAAARDVLSAQLRRVLAVEFARLGLPTDGFTPPPDRPSGRAPDSPSDDLYRSSDGLSDGASHPQEPVDNFVQMAGSASWDQPTRFIATVQVNRASDSPSDTAPDGITPSVRVVVTKALVEGPATHNPQPPTHGSAAHAGQTPEGEANPEQQLIETIRSLRPEWSARSIRRTIHDETINSRPWPIVAAALGLIAADPQSQAPGRLKADGPWWASAAAAARMTPGPDVDPALVHDLADGCCNLPARSRYHRDAGVIQLDERRTA